VRDADPSDTGRAVHWYVQDEAGPSVPMAALIVAVHSPTQVALAIIHPSGMQFLPVADLAHEPTPMHWCWPPWTR
jgi:hypothetical protein